MAEELTEEQKAERQAALTKAYGTATAQLRKNHQDEFNDLYTKAAAELGHEWHPRLTAEQRASQEFDRLVEEFPFLRDRLPTDGPAGAESGPAEAQAG
jgi:hypothetical protein